MPSAPWVLDPDRIFSPEPAQRSLARELYAGITDLPLVCPHGHVPPGLLADPDATLGTPAELFVIPDHYVFRMLHSQGIPLEDLGVPSRDGTPVEADHRRIWQRFAENFYLFRGTPSGLWLATELVETFGVEERLDGESAQRVYDHLEEKLAQREFSPRALFERFDIEVLCTTDAASDTLEDHRRMRADGLNVLPTFRPDAAVDIGKPDWPAQIEALAEASGTDVTDYAGFVRALEGRREFFKEMGALAADHSVTTPRAERLSEGEAGTIFGRALRGETTGDDAARFAAHMLMEFARMSAEDGLVMQVHAGSFRDHNAPLSARFGADKGADIPVATEWTRNLRPLLNEYGSDPRFRLILFTLDESTYSRELAPLAGHYPAMLLGPPWWFFDSPLGMERYLDAVVETAGIYNLAGFNDDTRAFASIPARHDVWRRAACDWLAGMVVRGLVEQEDAPEMAHELVYGLARKAYGMEPQPARSAR